ncbi:hypothetical protein AURDEDRAFT_152115 [Auricularia subglabra TFB-10046 SS5]|uniref:MYND-type domain-containing protein n=1 Tax=Auricularia subglabra (strain TFB-10046 / SS5) TaxID=717982 RepID=J0WZ98_AURST|nr:hypothetical protein AURDEDRAFT_152115 [Auricularia subglabra TFB-10046 SS5]
MLWQAMETLVGSSDLPDVTAKQGLKDCFRSLDKVIGTLVTRSKLSVHKDDHIDSAVQLYLLRMASDICMVEEMTKFSEITDLVVDALESKCGLRILAGLQLVMTLVRHGSDEYLCTVSQSILHRTLGLIIASRRDDLIVELCWNLFTSWAHGIGDYARENGHPLIVTMECMVAAGKKTLPRRTVSQLLYRLQWASTSTGVLLRGPDELVGFMRKYFIAALRFDSAADRMSALRGLYYALSWERDDERESVYPTTQMTATDFTCISGVTNFRGLDTSWSDAKHVLDLSAAFYDLMRDFCTSHDFHGLGDSLHQLLLQDPRSVDFSARAISKFAGGKAPEEFALPFADWADTLRHCANCLTACAAVGHNHWQAIQILEMQSYILSNHASKAAERASGLVKKGDVSVPWYLYALAHSDDEEHLIQVFDAVRRLDNLVGAQEAPRLRRSAVFQCTLVAVTLSGLAFAMEQGIRERDEGEWTALASMLSLSGWTATEYLRCASWDGQYVAAMREAAIVVWVVTERPTSPTSPTAPTGLEARWRAAVDIHSRVWSRPSTPHFRTVVSTLYADFASAVEAMGDVLDHHLKTTPARSPGDERSDISRGDSHIGERTFSSKQLAAWRAALGGDISANANISWRHAPMSLLNPMLQLNNPVEMRKCGHCAKRSTLLRRCGSCRDVRYCSKDCQAKDWRIGHKAACVRVDV